MKRVLFAIIAVMAVSVIFSGCSKAHQTDKPLVPSIAAEHEKTEEKIYAKGAEIFIYNDARPETLTQEEKISKGAVLTVLSQENDFYHVSYEHQGQQKEGYIPTWYLDDKEAKATAVEANYQVLKQDTKGLLYPEGPKIIELEQGKLLKPFMESGDWVQVDIIVYDIPAVLKAWIKKDSLVSTLEMQAKEGFITSDAELYLVDDFKEIQNTKPVKEDYPKNVFIKKRQEGYAYVGAAGGWTAWVEEKWIRYTDKDFK